MRDKDDKKFTLKEINKIWRATNMNSTKNLLIIIIIMLSVPVLLNCTVLFYWTRKCLKQHSKCQKTIVDMEEVNPDNDMSKEEMADE